MSTSRIKTSSILQGFPKSRSLLTGNAAYIPKPIVTGGTLTSDATYYYRTFTANGTLSVSNSSLTADVLMIGGGGSSNISDGSNPGTAGGGGAGGAVYGTGLSFSTSSYAIVVGAGGSNSGGQSGNDSTFNSITAKGGGGAYKPTDGSADVGRPGGCGGGESYGSTYTNTSNQGTFSGYTSYGNRGGRPSTSFLGGYQSKYPGGGGLGGFIDHRTDGEGDTNEVAGGPGLNTWSSWATVTSTGVSGFYGGGGGGVNGYNGGYGAGGSGGGGAASRPNATSGTANTGGGGGSAGAGSQFVTTYGGNGGSGLFIIRYTKVQVD